MPASEIPVADNLVAAEAPPTAPANLTAEAAAPQAAGRLGELLQRANEHEQQGRRDAAEATLDKVLADAPDEPAALHLAGIIAFKRARHADAAALMERSLAKAPANPLFHRNICEVYRVLGRYDAAAAAG